MKNPTTPPDPQKLLVMARAVLGTVLEVAMESDGVAGYHQNGTILRWNEIDLRLAKDVCQGDGAAAVVYLMRLEEVLRAAESVISTFRPSPVPHVNPHCLDALKNAARMAQEAEAKVRELYSPGAPEKALEAPKEPA